MFAYDGWDGLALVAGEVRDPKRTLPRGTLLGMAMILVVYLAVNAGFFHALPFGEMASTPALAATAVGRVIGDHAARFVTAFVAFSAASTVFSSLLCNRGSSRLACGRRSVFPRRRVCAPRWKTPVVAIAIYGVMIMPTSPPARVSSGSRVT